MGEGEGSNRTSSEAKVDKQEEEKQKRETEIKPPVTDSTDIVRLSTASIYRFKRIAFSPHAVFLRSGSCAALFSTKRPGMTGTHLYRKPPAARRSRSLAATVKKIEPCRREKGQPREQEQKGERTDIVDGTPVLLSHDTVLRPLRRFEVGSEEKER